MPWRRLEGLTDLARRERGVGPDLLLASTGLAGGERARALLRDLLDDEEFERRCAALTDELGWTGPVFAISSVTRRGLDALVQALAARLDELRREQAGPTVVPDQEPYDPLES